VSSVNVIFLELKLNYCTNEAERSLLLLLFQLFCFQQKVSTVIAQSSHMIDNIRFSLNKQTIGDVETFKDVREHQL
jgi:hypothetical protein